MYHTVILLIILIAYHNRWRTKQRLNESLLLAELLQGELDANESRLSVSSMMMMKILAPRHSLLDTLCTAVYENGNNGDDSTK